MILPIVMVLVSALLHALWNLQVKRSVDKTLFTYLYVWSAIIVYTPVFLCFAPSETVPWQAWACVLTTGSVYCFYFLLLARSYHHGALSHAYPLARGIAPVLTLVWAVIFLSERPSPVGLFGIILVVSSIFLFHRPSAEHLPARSPLHELARPVSIAALGTGLTISIYSVVDKVGVSFVNPAVYIYLTFLVAAILLTPFYVHRYGSSGIRQGLSDCWRHALLVGAICISAYLIVLFAMQMTDVSYILPLRSTSILFAALLGFEVLNEEKTYVKFLAASTMMVGVLFIALS